MKLKLGLCQMKVTADKAENLRHARELIDKAAAGGAELVLLPEMFNCPYENAAFPVYAEPAGGGELADALPGGEGKRRLAGGRLCAGAGGREDLQHLLYLRPER